MPRQPPEIKSETPRATAFTIKESIICDGSHGLERLAERPEKDLELDRSHRATGPIQRNNEALPRFARSRNLGVNSWGNPASFCARLCLHCLSSQVCVVIKSEIRC